MDNKKIVFFGAGAIGGSVGAWIAEHYDGVYFLDQGKTAEAIAKNGITTYPENQKDKAVNVKVKVITDLSECPDADIVVVAVKTYSLDGVCTLIKSKLKKEPLIVALQNGVDNQKIVPKYFKKVVYGVVSYNAWPDEAGVIGYQKKGPLIIGTPDGSCKEELELVSRLFNLGVETIVTEHFSDAAHCKMIINLTNSLTTLIGHRYQPVTNMKLFKKVLTSMTREGIRAVSAAGYSECKLGGMPSWTIMKLGAALPYFLAKGIFQKNVAKMVLSSMAQDVLMRKGKETELDTINGYLIELGEKNGQKMPFNRAVYELCKTEFAKDNFVPLPIETVWQHVKKYL
jgi:2-dehydropantoate 2-reductase